MLVVCMTGMLTQTTMFVDFGNTDVRTFVYSTDILFAIVASTHSINMEDIHGSLVFSCYI